MNESLLKLGKVWKKINIWEVSACGIPMYPKAHKSFSLVKALQESEDLVSDELNEEEKPMEDSEKPEEKSEGEEDSGSESETSEEKPAEESAEAPAVEPGEAPEETKEGEESEEAKKSIDGDAKILQDAIVKGFRIAIKEASTERGLVSEEKSLQEKMSEELKTKSIGELAVMSGLFGKPPMIGSTREII